MNKLEVKRFNYETHGKIGVVQKELLPFSVRRIFWIKDVSWNETRGGHAHKECHQVIIPIFGGVNIKADSTIYVFFPWSNSALYVPPGHKIELSGFSEDTIILVLCSHEYDVDDYIYD